MSKTRVLTGLLTLSLVASMATAVVAQDEEATPDEEPTAQELLATAGEPVEVTDTDIEALAIELEELRLGILGNTEYIDALRTDLIRESIDGNTEGVARLRKVVAGLNVDKLRVRVHANQAVLKELTQRHLALAAKLKENNALTNNLRRRVEQLEVEVQGE